jgi:hypothetical protein
LPLNITSKAIPIAQTANPYPIEINQMYFLKPIALTASATTNKIEKTDN